MAMAMAMAIAMTTPQAIIYNFNLLLSSTNCRHGWMLFIIRDVNLTVKFIISNPNDKRPLTSFESIESNDPVDIAKWQWQWQWQSQ